MSIPSYFPVENMQYLYVVWNWYRYLYTKLFSCAKYAIFTHMVWNWYRYLYTKLFSCTKYAMFTSIYPHGLKVVSLCWHQIISIWNTWNIYTHCLKIGIETLKPNVFLFVKYSIIINILFIVSMSKPNVLFQPWQIITVFLCVYIIWNIILYTCCVRSIGMSKPKVFHLR